MPPGITSDPFPKKRDIAGRITVDIEKRGSLTRLSRLGGCTLSTAVESITLPVYPRARSDILSPDVAGTLAVSLSVISRYDRATSDGCVFTTTRLSADSFVNAPEWRDTLGIVRIPNSQLSLDHACK